MAGTKTSEINFKIQLDEKNVPQEISWNATDSTNNEQKDCKAIMLALWDKESQNTLRIDLWTKQMTVEEYANFYLQTLMTTAEAFERATGNPIAQSEMKKFCQEFSKKTNDLLEQQKQAKEQKNS